MRAHPTLVFVGLRSGAVDAAERLGRPVIGVVERPPGPRLAARLADVIVTDFESLDRPETLGAVADRLPEAGAVVALTERSVLPAARLRHALGIPGVSVETARRCSDKRAMKRAARAAGLRCADTVESEHGLPADALVERLGLPMVLKAAIGSGGRGTHVVSTRSDVPDVLPPGWIAESFVDGVEMSVETIVADGRAAFVNPTQYLTPAWSSLAPAPLGPDLDAALAHNQAAWRGLGVERGMTHLELFLTADGPVFSEMAVRPPGGHLMRLMELAYGFDPWEAVLRAECGDPLRLPQRARQTAAVQILHPGPGVVRVAGGAERARSMAGVQDVALRVGVGDAVGPRWGTGQEVGHVVVTGSDASQARARLADAVAAILVEVTRTTEAESD